MVKLIISWFPGFLKCTPVVPAVTCWSHWFHLRIRLILLLFIFLPPALKLRMARRCAAVPRICRPPRDWFYTPTWQAMASAGSRSCIALTATMNCHQSPCLETHPSLGSCELFTSKPSSIMTWLWSTVCVFVFNSESLLSSHPISGMGKTWLWLRLPR